MRVFSSIRGRATLGAALLFAAALVVAGIALVTVLRTTMVDNVDTTLRLRAADLGALTGSGVAPRDIAIPDDGRSFAQIVFDGDVIASSRNVRGQPPVVVPGGGESLTVRETSGDEEEFRIVTRSADSPIGPVRIVVGASLYDVERTTRVATIALVVGGMLLTGVVGATTWSVVRRSLRPVDSMRRELAEITATNLDRRVPQSASDDEVRRLAEVMNSMLDRLDAETRTQREFTSAASHELRTPITIVRHQLETALTAADPDWDHVAGTVLTENDRMQRLVDDLLLLARRDAGLEPTQTSSLVDLDDLVLEEVGHTRDRPQDVRIDVSEVSAGQVRGDADRLRRVVRNLLDNALRHAATRVVVSVDGDGERVRLRVVDDGAGIPSADRERVFERFVRLDESRSRTDGGSGLGLAIVHDIVESHGGSVVISDAAILGGASFTVSLPDARAPRPE